MCNVWESGRHMGGCSSVDQARVFAIETLKGFAQVGDNVEVAHCSCKVKAHNGARGSYWIELNRNSAGQVADWKMKLPKHPSGSCS